MSSHGHYFSLLSTLPLIILIGYEIVQPITQIDVEGKISVLVFIIQDHYQAMTIVSCIAVMFSSFHFDVKGHNYDTPIFSNCTSF